MTLSIGDKAPDFTALTDSDGKITLSEFEGKPVVLYFYPKDDTPGCTKEACAFRDDYSEYQDMGAVILGVSKDSPSKHDKFKSKYDLPFTLISDEDGAICEAYGRTYMGIQRATFLIDSEGKIAKIWPKVKVKEHNDEVKAAISALKT